MSRAPPPDGAHRSRWTVSRQEGRKKQMQAPRLDLFEEDVAAEVADIFSDAVADGLSVRTATRRVVEELDDYLEDEEQQGLVWLALAVLQLEHGALQPTVRHHALAALACPERLWRVEEDEEEQHAERQQLIAQLTAQLTDTSSVSTPSRARV
jgi:hypothetical protein